MPSHYSSFGFHFGSAHELTSFRKLKYAEGRFKPSFGKFKLSKRRFKPHSSEF